MREELASRLREIVEVLCNEIGPRSIYNYSSLCESARYIKEQVVRCGVSFTVQDFTVSAHKSVENIMVFINGAPERPYYLVGAHYDTVSTTPGADDNASSVAVILELLRLTANRVRKPLAFVFFTLAGLRGIMPPAIAGVAVWELLGALAVAWALRYEPAQRPQG